MPRPTHLVAAVLLLSAVAAAKKITTTTQSETETLTVRTKSGKVGPPINFRTAESRVTDLISKLDSVSGHAARAENELQATLRELWQIVDLLGKDRCGDVVERVRVLQRNMQTRIEEQENELGSQRVTVSHLEADVRSKTAEIEATKAELVSARETRSNLEAELAEVRAKLQRVTAQSNRDGSYKLLVTRLEKLLSIAVARTETLERIIALLNDDQRVTSDWKKELSSISVSVRSVEEEFTSGASGAEVRARARVAQLEAELREAAAARDDATRERKSLAAAMERLQRRVETRGTGSRERIIIRDEDGSWVGVLTLCFISLCTGAVAVFFLNAWQGARAEPQAAERGPAGSPAEKFGFSPSGNRSPAFHHSKSSPMQYVHDSANKGTTPRTGTPRLY